MRIITCMRAPSDKNNTIKNVLTMVVGTGGAQLIPIIASPFLTRLYSPEEMGNYAIFSSIVAILMVVATGRYELALGLPRLHKHAVNLVFLIMLISLIISFVILMVVVCFGADIARYNNFDIIPVWFYFIPVAVALSGISQSIQYWFNRMRYFHEIAKNRMLASLVISIFQLSLSRIVNGLIIGYLLGAVISLAILLNKFWKKDLELLSKARLKSLCYLIKKYSDFPRYSVPASALNVVANQSPNFIFAVFFGPSYAGYYYLTQRVMQAPVAMLSTSILDVFRENVSRKYREKKDVSRVFIKTFVSLIILAIIPSMIVYLYAESIFPWVFGSEWYEVGVYAKIMVPALFLRFTVSPLTCVVYIAGKQKLNIIGMIALVIMICVSFDVGKTAVDVVTNISLSYIIFYLYYFIISARISKVI